MPFFIGTDQTTPLRIKPTNPSSIEVIILDIGRLKSNYEYGIKSEN